MDDGDCGGKRDRLIELWVKHLNFGFSVKEKVVHMFMEHENVFLFFSIRIRGVTSWPFHISHGHILCSIWLSLTEF